MSIDTYALDLHEPATFFAAFRRLRCPLYRPVDPPEMPPDARRLLQHRAHMTTTLEEFYGGEVTIRVLERARRGHWYTRAVLLDVTGQERPVEFGIMALDLAAVGPEVARQVLEARTPLGTILIAHHPLRTVVPMAYWAFEPNDQWCRWFGLQRNELCYGRTAVIHCGEGPTVLLLEVVRPPDSR